MSSSLDLLSTVASQALDDLHGPSSLDALECISHPMDKLQRMLEIARRDENTTHKHLIDTLMTIIDGLHTRICDLETTVEKTSAVEAKELAYTLELARVESGFLEGKKLTEDMIPLLRQDDDVEDKVYVPLAIARREADVVALTKTMETLNTLYKGSWIVFANGTVVHRCSSKEEASTWERGFRERKEDSTGKWCVPVFTYMVEAGAPVDTVRFS